MRRLCISLVLVLTAPIFAADWPQFRGPNGDGFSTESGLNKNWNTKAPPVLWEARMQDHSYATLSAADGKVFVIDHANGNDIVRAIDLAKGTDVWTLEYPEPVKDDHGVTRCTPVYDNGKLYTLSGGGTLNCLDAKTGAKVWAKNIIDEFHGQIPHWNLAASPLVDGDKLIVCPGGEGAGMVALDKATGKEIWRGGGSDAPGYDTPAIATLDGKKQYVYLTPKQLIGVSAEDGKLLWHIAWSANGINCASPLVMGNSVFVTGGYGKGCGLVEVDGGNATLKWSNKEMQSHFNTPVFFGGNIYGTTDPGALICLDPKTGNALWRQKGFEKGGVLGVDGVLIAVDGHTGEVAMVQLDPSGYKELGRVHPLKSQTNWPPPILADGKLIVRGPTSMVCLDLKN